MVFSIDINVENTQRWNQKVEATIANLVPVPEAPYSAPWSRKANPQQLPDFPNTFSFANKPVQALSCQVYMVQDVFAFVPARVREATVLFMQPYSEQLSRTVSLILHYNIGINGLFGITGWVHYYNDIKCICTGAALINNISLHVFQSSGKSHHTHITYFLG